MNTLRLISSILLVLAARPALNHSVWTNERDEFVADAGTMTVTTTLIFSSRSDVTVRTKAVMPPHPATFVNENGKVDTNPGWESGWDTRGKYRYRRGKLTISLEDGETMELTYREGVLVKADPYHKELVFRRQER